MNISKLSVLASEKIGELKKFSNLPVNDNRHFNCPLCLLSFCFNALAEDVNVNFETWIMKNYKGERPTTYYGYSSVFEFYIGYEFEDITLTKTDIRNIFSICKEIAA